jgi:MoaA/NifB/PqqE/SkfB family radical SAM enzyme
MMGRPKGIMSFETFRSVLDELCPYLYLVHLYNWGEPLLNPEIGKMISYAHDQKVGTSMSTNLNHLSDRQADELIRSKLDYLIVSFDGLSPETYSMYRKLGNFEAVLANIRKLVEKKRYFSSRTPKIVWQFLVFRHNQHEVKKIKAMARCLGFDQTNIKPALVDNPEWLPNGKGVVADGKLKQCHWLWYNAVINWDGGVSPCCRTFFVRDDFGNVKDSPFSIIWNNEKFITARELFARTLKGNEPGPHFVCSRCLQGGLWRNMAIE